MVQGVFSTTKGSTETVYIAASGTPLPVSVSANSDNGVVTTCTFSNWSEPVDLAAPPHSFPHINPQRLTRACRYFARKWRGPCGSASATASSAGHILALRHPCMHLVSLWHPGAIHSGPAAPKGKSVLALWHARPECRSLTARYTDFWAKSRPTCGLCPTKTRYTFARAPDLCP